MLKNVLTWALCCVLIAGALSSDAFAIRSVQSADRSVRTRVLHLNKLIETLGSGEEALVAVRLCDKSVISGYVDRIDRDSFVVMDPKTGEASTVAYEQVKRLQGFNIVTGTEVHQGVGIRAKLARVASFLVPGQRVQRNNLTKTHAILIGIVIGVLIVIVVARAL